MDTPQTPPKPDEPVAEPAPQQPVEPANGPSANEFVAPVNVPTAETSRAEAAPTATPTAPPDTVAGEATMPPGEVATRYCPRCGDRVPMAADGLHCHLGHRLSGAHREPRRRWFRRRR